MPAQIRTLPTFTAMKPDAHGGYFLLMDGEVVLVVPYGTWGMRCTQNYIADISRIVRANAGKRFGCVVVFDDWQLGTPVVIQQLRQFNELAANNHGMQAQCFVGQPTSTPLRVAEQQIAPKIDRLSITRSFADAMDHFLNLGFEFSQQLFTRAYTHRHALLSESKR